MYSQWKVDKKTTETMDYLPRVCIKILDGTNSFGAMTCGFTNHNACNANYPVIRKEASNFGPMTREWP